MILATFYLVDVLSLSILSKFLPSRSFGGCITHSMQRTSRCSGRTSRWTQRDCCRPFVHWRLRRNAWLAQRRVVRWSGLDLADMQRVRVVPVHRPWGRNFRRSFACEVCHLRLLDEFTLIFSWFINMCTDAFGPQFNITYIEEAVRRTRRKYGGRDHYNVRTLLMSGKIRSPFSKI